MSLVEDAKKFGRPSVWLLDEIRSNILGNKGRSDEEINEAIIYAYHNIEKETGTELFNYIKNNKDYEIIIDRCNEMCQSILKITK